MAAGAHPQTRPRVPRAVVAAIWLCVISAAHVGCAARRHATAESVPRVGASSIEDFQPPPTPTPDRRPPLILPPQVLRRELPRYPESALAERVACVARILYHVDTAGRATLVRLEWVEPPPAEHVRAFEEALRTALSDWRFEPAVRVVPEKRSDGSIEPLQTPVPAAQHAFVRFRVENGQAIVE